MLRKAVLALACLLPMTAALPCSEDFGPDPLSDRKASLLGAPAGTFYYEAAHLVPAPADHLVLDEHAYADAEAPFRDLPASAAQGVKAMRAAPDAASAEKAGAGLEPELVEYTLGAMAFTHRDLAGATAHFERVLALPAPQQRRRGLWALYMLARARAAGGDNEAAVTTFEAVRKRALAGADDPVGLAVASYGEQARIAWHRGAATEAVHLYAQQAAHGSAGGGASLLFVTRSLMAHPGLLDKSLDDPLVQRMLSAYLYTRSDEFGQGYATAGSSDADAVAATPEPADAGAAATAPDPTATASDKADAGAAPTAPDTAATGTDATAHDTADAVAASSAADGVAASPTKDAGAAPTPAHGMDVEAFLAAVQRHGLEHFDGADRLAAGAYATGHYDLAARLAAKSNAPLAAWIRAKLALRAGDQAAALREYALAERGFKVLVRPGVDAAADDSRVSYDAVEQELGTLSLGRGDYIDAMARMFGAHDGTYWSDVAYIAERVLTVDELKAWVDTNVPKPALNGAPWTVTLMRSLLGRRLLREGRDDQSLAYFDDPEFRAKAQALMDARRALRDAWTDNAKAIATHRLAVLLHDDGPELLNVESPDFTEAPVPPDGSAVPEHQPPKPREFLASAEIARTIANAARYRELDVVDLEAGAATLVPARSQAYAALMCKAIRWTINRDAERAQSLWRRYLREGPHVAWASSFGQTSYRCPDPDFAAAKWLPWKERWWQARHWTRRQWPLLAGGLGLAALLVATRRRRGKA